MPVNSVAKCDTDHPPTAQHTQTKDTNSRITNSYRKEAHKEYLHFARCRERSRKLIRESIKKQLGYLPRESFAYRYHVFQWKNPLREAIGPTGNDPEGL
jgi:hypothetical protein